MKKTTVTCTGTKTLSDTGKVTLLPNSPQTITSAVFPAYLPSGKKVALPTPTELITEGNKKYDSNLPFLNYAIKAIDGSTSLDPAASIEVTGTGTSYSSDTYLNIFVSNDTYIAKYTYAYDQIEGPAPATRYRYTITYEYQFSAVENKLPLKPWTILGVVERILDIAEPIYSDGVNTPVAHPRYIVDPDQRDWLEYEDKEKKALRLAPEFTMTRCTLREQLQVVGSYIHAEPRLIHKTVDGVDRYCIHFDPYGETIQSPAKGYPYVFRRRMQSINQYCTSVSSITENMVNSTKWARGAVVHPWSGSGLSTRCATEHVRSRTRTVLLRRASPSSAS